ncbi:YIP1 family protein [Methanospirillum lacunae]|uniref:Yip1 domain-containing protein n=1 Tax=Methanospirillum lacunae TaxID=668570 RepID=A0A2V2NG57_9EURY|nr:YIP1 family protein [Methanospirillum lacunae]PWR74303.1 hypothetical protein DK846_03925 [Methanospirillum lacunae]
MFEDLIPNIRGLLLSPVETFENLKKSSLSESHQHFVILLLVYTVLVGVVTAISSLMAYYNMMIQLISIPIIGQFLLPKIELFKPIILNLSFFSVYLLFITLFFGIFLKGFFLHVFVILLGGEQGVTKTIQVLMYSITPFLLLGWIPYISILGLIWTLILCVIGFHIIQEIPVWKSALIIIIPIIFLFTGLILVFFITSSLITATSGIV